MNCPKCGSNMATGFQVCSSCGYKVSYGGNTEFFKKAVYSKLTLKDVFSDVFKKHNIKDGEKMFMAGTSLTTPSEREMLSEWKKPWLFARVGAIGLIFIALLYVLLLNGAEVYALIPLVFAGATIIPLAVLLLFWEMNIPRNIPIYSIITMFLLGGTVSLIITWIFNSILGSMPPYLAPLTEEPAKLLALCIFLRKPKNKYILNGILIGAAIGTGFAAIETMGYALRHQSYTSILLMRGILSPGCHVAWAALYGGALAMVKGSQKLETKHFTDSNFLKFFGISFLLHLLWNSDFSLISIPIFVDLKFLLLTLAVWIALLMMLSKGIQQVLNISAAAPSVPHNNFYQPVNPAPATLQGISGVYKDFPFPISEGKLVFGRDSNRANIVYSNTPGISSVHCEVRNEGGKTVLVDRGSSYGTFLGNGTRLVLNQPYVLQRGDRFYLANQENQFKVM